MTPYADDSPDDSSPLAVLYRDTTLVGGTGNTGGDPRVELDLNGRRNAFALVQAGASAGVPADLIAAASVPGGGPGSPAIRHVTLTMADLVVVNIPVGRPSSWPIGLLSTDMDHVGLNRSAGSPFQLYHLRVIIVLQPGLVRYYSAWYHRYTSPMLDERSGSAWVGDLMNPAVQVVDVDGYLTLHGTTRSYVDKYNVTAKSTRLLTAATTCPVDLWAIEDPPAAPTTITFAANGSQLLQRMQDMWTGPRVIVLMGDVPNTMIWPKEDTQLAFSLTIAAASPDARPELDMRGVVRARTAPGYKVSFRNIRATHLWPSVSWALSEAPDSLPGVPGYDAWRSRCLPGSLQVSQVGAYEMHGSVMEMDPDVYSLMLSYNNLLCADNRTAAAGVACPPPPLRPDGSSSAFPFVPASLKTFMERLFRVGGQEPIVVASPDSDSMFLASNTFGRTYLNSTVFKRSPAALDMAESPCGLRAMLNLLRAAQNATFTPPPPVAVPLAAATDSGGGGGSNTALVAGVAAAAGFVALAAVATAAAMFWIRRHPPPAEDLEAGDEAKAGVALLGKGSAPGDPALGTGTGSHSRSNHAAGSAGSKPANSGKASSGRAGSGADGSPLAATPAGPMVALLTEPPPPPPAHPAPAAAAALTVSVAVPARQVQQPAAAQAAAAPAAPPTSPAAAAPEPDLHRGSAFSHSFVRGDLEPGQGQAATMFEQVLARDGFERPPPPPFGLPLAAVASCTAAVPTAFAGALGPAYPKTTVSEAATVSAATAAVSPTAAAPEAGGAHGFSVVGPAAAAAAAAMAAGRAVAGGGGCYSTDLRSPGLTTGTSVTSGSAGADAHRMLTGEIDGMIRKFEKTTTAAVPGLTTPNSSRQEVLGAGANGVVYKGEWRGLPVAIKVVLLQEGDSAARRERLIREVALSATLSHPNVVATYNYTVQPIEGPVTAAAVAGTGNGGPMLAGALPLMHRPNTVDPGARWAPGAARPPAFPAADVVFAYKLSIVMSYCDRGTLRDAIREGLLRQPWQPAAPPASGWATATGGASSVEGSGSGGAAAAHAQTAALGTGAAAVTGGRGAPSSPSCSPPKEAEKVKEEEEAGIPRRAGAAAPDDAEAEEVPVGPEAGGQRRLRSPPPSYAPSGYGRVETWNDLRASPNQPMALFAALDVARGMAYLHACNVVHGDLSLQNILITSSTPVFPESTAAAAFSSLSTSSNITPFMTGATGLSRMAAALHGVLGKLHDDEGTGSAGSAAGAGCAPLRPPSGALDTGKTKLPPTAEVPSGEVCEASLAGPCRCGLSPPTPDAIVTAGACITDSNDPAAAPTVAAGAAAAGGAASKRAVRALAAAVADGLRGSSETTPDVDADLTLATGSASACASASASATASASAARVAAAAGGAAGGTTGGLSIETNATEPMLWALPEEAPTPPLSHCTATGLGGEGGQRGMVRRAQAVLPLLSQVFKISDFGLSVRLEGDETHRSGLHQGTPFYTAPEVLINGKVAAAADIYSLGVIMWCLVHGVSLCQLRHLLPHMYTPVAPTLLAHLAPDLAPGVRGLLRRCMAGEPARRPTAVALVGELQLLLQAAVGPELAPVVLGAERRERDAGRTVAGAGLLDSSACSWVASAPANGGV
ncbi:hypothetical protein HYH03_018272 [Edaphochlamys debaryana]|uniref:Protein kinase domain-containing protein n=1 Tax=Edaphochlamys debaryana TaxID=47281 RepID=A0A835XGC7_9CHLO|nr:hypothetical protein HYH03_018272 [Edaphochlamys debaryana]|eukprot:KAG2482835.1 hypothetical protein HYH03_018272 [Edaphochlamys debaryana]